MTGSIAIRRHSKPAKTRSDWWHAQLVSKMVRNDDNLQEQAIHFFPMLMILFSLNSAKMGLLKLNTR
jgi:hypothetical protein